MSELELAGAKVVMAQYFIHGAIEDWEENSPWEDNPDIGELDFGSILIMMKQEIPERPPLSLWIKAYDYLKERADNEIV